LKFNDLSTCYLELQIYIDINGTIWFEKTVLSSKDSRNNSVEITPVLIEDESTLGYLKLQELKLKETQSEIRDKAVEEIKKNLNDLENKFYKFKSKIQDFFDVKVSKQVEEFKLSGVNDIWNNEKLSYEKLQNEFNDSIEANLDSLLTDYNLFYSQCNKIQSMMNFLEKILEIKYSLFDGISSIKTFLTKSDNSQVDVESINLFSQQTIKRALLNYNSYDEYLKSLKQDLEIVDSYKYQLQQCK
jgi:hypothetical protein